jgi:hypothetical protein
VDIVDEHDVVIAQVETLSLNDGDPFRRVELDGQGQRAVRNPGGLRPARATAATA